MQNDPCLTSSNLFLNKFPTQYLELRDRPTAFSFFEEGGKEGFSGVFYFEISLSRTLLRCTLVFTGSNTIFNPSSFIFL